MSCAPFGTAHSRPQPPCFGATAPRPRILYHRGRSNICPGCAKQQWFIGRLLATCAFCETSLPLACPLEPPADEFLKGSAQ